MNTTTTLERTMTWSPSAATRPQLGTRQAADALMTLLLLGDVLTLGATFTAAYFIRFHSIAAGAFNATATADRDMYSGIIGLSILVLVALLGARRLYRFEAAVQVREAFLEISKGVMWWLAGCMALSFALKLHPSLSRGYLFLAAGLCLAGMLAWRMVFHRMIGSSSIASALRRRVIFIGWTAESARMNEIIRSSGNPLQEVVGWVSAGAMDHPAESEIRPPCPHMGEYHSMTKILEAHRVDIVILAAGGLAHQDIIDLATLCERELVEFKVIPSYFQILLSALDLESIHGVPVLGISKLPLDSLFNRLLKRGLDIAGALVGLVLSAPVIAVFSALVYIESPGPIFYWQVRTGRNGSQFKIVKIRSMRLDAEANGAQWAKEADPRRLKIGAWMREWNIDELPQFWNVLKGEMSLVGPRPERPELIASFKHQIPHYNARLSSKPGLTGWAQVNGLRGNTSLSERIRYDLHYLENWSLWFDIQTMVLTFFRRENAY